MVYSNFSGFGEVSLLGFGCMRFPTVSPDSQEIDEKKALPLIEHAYKNGINYFDTAYTYHNETSESFVKKALAAYPRESYFLADKLPTFFLKDKGDPKRFFEEQLKRCGTDYIDFYLLHSLDADNTALMEQFGAYEYAFEMKKQGKVRHLGFSFHGRPDELPQLLDRYEFDFAQLQLNYLDWELQDAKTQYETLTERGIPVVVMEPVRGGALSTLSDKALEILHKENQTASAASWAMRYVYSLDNILIILSGMSAIPQIDDNLATFSERIPLTENERRVLSSALTAYKASGTIPCTGCNYCMDCPFGVDIPRVFSTYNQYRTGRDTIMFELTYNNFGEEKQAHHCTACGACMKMCPQSIDIPARMVEVKEFAASIP
ncbi:MAG: aldo/keto reductase [Christensenellaceae bacterium]|jgi:predicted aldo/keto reductase-like oxidoreductase